MGNLALPVGRLLAPALVFCSSVAALPLVYGVVSMVLDPEMRQALGEYYGGSRSLDLLRSLALPASVAASSACLALVAGVAWFHGSPQTRQTLHTSVWLPLVIHPMVLVFGLLVVLRQGAVADALEIWVPGEHGAAWFSVGVVMVLLLYPLAAWPTFLALQRVPLSQVAAARSLGAGPWRVSRDVLWPNMRTALAAGAVLVFLHAAGFFVAPVLLGDGWVTTLPVWLADRLDLGMTDQAWVMGLALLMPLWALAFVTLPALSGLRLWED